jgi:alkanesulfonate monooxygenase SsuD/methylene tetrahydromethanopterin reductase-like flavin-dependent oxidoreductase (luciferase family)
MALRFGIFDHLEKRDLPLADLYRERLEYIERADQLGFWCYHKAEHHMTPLDGAPAGNMFLTAAAVRTQRIRLGALVHLLPFPHPIRLLEEICVLDQLSGGRVEMGVGRGISPPEHSYWGLDPDAGRSLTEESLAILVAGFGAERITHRGTHFRFDDAPIEVAPLQRPRPPLWYPGNPAFAGEHGLHTVVFGPVPGIAQAVEVFREAATETTTAPINAGPLTIGALRHVFVAETDAAAEVRARQSWARYTANLSKLFREAGLPIPMDPTVGGDFDKARQVCAAVVGSPETVAEDVAAFASDSGSDYYIGAFAWGDLEHAESMRSLELFAKEVMPRFAPAG